MIIDADAHVEESEAMFDRLDKEFRPRRPLPVRFATDTVYGKYNAVWLIDGIRDQFVPVPGWTDLLVDLPTRFLPPGYLGELEVTFLPVGPAAGRCSSSSTTPTASACARHGS